MPLPPTTLPSPELLHDPGVDADGEEVDHGGVKDAGLTHPAVRLGAARDPVEGREEPPGRVRQELEPGKECGDDAVEDHVRGEGQENPQLEEEVKTIKDP